MAKLNTPLILQLRHEVVKKRFLSQTANKAHLIPQIQNMKTGDQITIRINHILEKKKQVFRGICHRIIYKPNSTHSPYVSLKIHQIVGGEKVEHVFPLLSPTIDSISIESKN